MLDETMSAIWSAAVVALSCVRASAVAVLCAGVLLGNAPAGTALAANTDAASFGALTCQQLWYLEQEQLADGRVCLKTNRARQAFRSSKPCLSDDERILPRADKERLKAIRSTARSKGCQGF